MKYLKIFESFLPRKESILNECWYNAEIGDILSESSIYNYVEELHRNEDDFIDGDIGERIERFSKYELKELNISDISIDEYELDDDYVSDYIDMYKKSGSYPPIVIDSDLCNHACYDNGKVSYKEMYNIIDGNHRVNSINNLGEKTIKAWVGII